MGSRGGGGRRKSSDVDTEVTMTDGSCVVSLSVEAMGSSSDGVASE